MKPLDIRFDSQIQGVSMYTHLCLLKEILYLLAYKIKKIMQTLHPVCWYYSVGLNFEMELWSLVKLEWVPQILL